MKLHHRSSIFRKVNKLWVIGITAAVVVIVGVCMASWAGVFNGIKKNTYQLVNLTTGESYIGKLQSTSGRYVVLKNVYYQKNTTQADSSDITVLKLSSSVAKPDDVMRIASDKIVHWENLSGDSKIVQAIKQDGIK